MSNAPSLNDKNTPSIQLHLGNDVAVIYGTNI